MLEECAQAHGRHLPCHKEDGRPVLLGCLLRSGIGCQLRLGHIILHDASQVSSLQEGVGKGRGGGGSSYGEGFTADEVSNTHCGEGEEGVWGVAMIHDCQSLLQEALNTKILDKYKPKNNIS